MSEHLFEYIAIIILFILFILFLLRHKIREYFSPPMVQINQASLGIKVKSAYLVLLELLYHNSDKEGLEEEIRNISARRTDDRYIGGYTKDTYEFDSDSYILDYFYEVLTYTDAKGEDFIFTVTNTNDMEKLYYKLEKLFGGIIQNIDQTFLMNKDIKEGLLYYKNKLSKYKIEMTFISDGSDSYYFILYPKSKEKRVDDAIKKAGLERVIYS